MVGAAAAATTLLEDDPLQVKVSGKAEFITEYSSVLPTKGLIKADSDQLD